MRQRILWFWIAVLLLPACGHHHHHGFVPVSSGGGGNAGGTVSVTPVVFANFIAATNVIGQAGFAGQMPNQGGAAAANTLDAPFGRAGEGSLWVPDQGNNRVLGFNATPQGNGAAGDFALGQPDLVTTTAAVTPNKMSAPTDVWRQGTRLLVADRGNNRVLLWNGLPTSNGAAPNVVIGQPDFVSNGAATTQAGLSQPASVCIGGGRVFVADFANNRVLIWNSLPVADGTPANVVVGQADFVSAGAGTTAATLNGPTSVWSDGNRLVVCDSNNHRVLIFSPVPAANGAAASVVVGQPDFVTAAAGAGAAGLSSPASVFATGSQLLVADRGNNRVLNYAPLPLANQPAATSVLGQDGFANTTANDDDQNGAMDAAPSNRTLNTPTGVMLRGRLLFVTDQGNHRVLLFDGQ